jgi:histidinol dehydrogenase
MAVQIRKLDSTAPDFKQRLSALLAFEADTDTAIESAVANILADVKARGDAAVLEYTNRFDRIPGGAASMAAFDIGQAELDEALASLPEAQRAALQIAAERIRVFHERQKQELNGFTYTEPDGTVLGQRVTPLDRVGIYVPGGKAAYPSSVLMNAIPAQVAGVREIVMVVPTPDGIKNRMVLAAAAIAGVTRVITIGGAQAVGALAYGTATIPAVDKIVDLFSQAEHDELAQAILLCPSDEYIAQVEASIHKLLPAMPRRDTIATSLTDRGALVKVRDMEEACEIANDIAAEHLEISAEDPGQWASRIRHAGAMFLGRFSSESLGDYCCGPNHVLPTSRTARFSSPLGVYDFQKRSSVLMVSEAGAQTLGRVAAELAYGEGLQAHARSAELRLKPQS